MFVPAAGATREDDGYLLTVVSDLKQDASQLLVLDASGLDRIATVHLPRRGTGGIHGSWIPDTDLDTSAGWPPVAPGGSPRGPGPAPSDGSASASTLRQTCVYLA